MLLAATLELTPFGLTLIGTLMSMLVGLLIYVWRENKVVLKSIKDKQDEAVDAINEKLEALNESNSKQSIQHAEQRKDIQMLKELINVQLSNLGLAQKDMGIKVDQNVRDIGGLKTQVAQLTEWKKHQENGK